MFLSNIFNRILFFFVLKDKSFIFLHLRYWVRISGMIFVAFPAPDYWRGV